MKKCLEIIPAIFFSAGILLGCKKNSTSDPKDGTQSIKDKTWWGTMTYTGKTTEYYSVHFNADNSMVWSQYSGEYTGMWAINKKKLTMTFELSGVKVTADISDDNKLINIVDNTASYNINSGEITINPNQSLDNTIWKGHFDISGSPQLLLFSFSPGSVIKATLGSLPDRTYNYTRSSSGAAIRFNTGGMYPFFAVIISGNEMKGSTTSSGYLLQVFKQ